MKNSLQAVLFLSIESGFGFQMTEDLCKVAVAWTKETFEQM